MDSDDSRYTTNSVDGTGVDTTDPVKGIVSYSIHRSHWRKGQKLIRIKGYRDFKAKVKFG